MRCIVCAPDSTKTASQAPARFIPGSAPWEVSSFGRRARAWRCRFARGLSDTFLRRQSRSHLASLSAVSRESLLPRHTSFYPSIRYHPSDSEMSFSLRREESTSGASHGAFCFLSSRIRISSKELFLSRSLSRSFWRANVLKERKEPKKGFWRE